MEDKAGFLAIAMVAILLGFTVLFGDEMSGWSDAYAQSAKDDITVTVPSSCTLSTTSGSGQTYDVSMTNGQYKNNIGTTTITTFCNNSDGFAIYAIGYSGDSFGNTTMISSNTTNPASTNIATGTATSGNTSNWAMKVEAVTGSGTGVYTPTILNNYSSFSVVPTTYTKIAAVNSVTDVINQASIKATYGVYLSRAQGSGTYTGKVRYTIVHPASEVPNQAYDTSTGKIGYYPNANGVTDTMGDQSISDTATNAVLWASNFKRDGYGFVGWSDAYDYVANMSSESNPNAHIYGPNETINFTAGQYSGTNDGLSLYAVWVKSAGTIQNWSGCSTMATGQVTALTDIRDNNTYAVAKLADNKCWMIENLRLGGNSAITLDSTTTNIADGTTFTLAASQDPTQMAWCIVNSSACNDQSIMYASVANPVANMADTDVNVISYGNYYNWYSATAGNGTYSFNTNNDSVTGDICPTGWRLPKGGNKARIESDNDNEFWNLVVYGLNNGVLPSNYSSTDYPYYTGVEATALSNTLRSYPNNFVYSGRILGSAFNNRGSGSGLWSATSLSGNFAYRLTLSSSAVSPAVNDGNKYNGRVVRCLVGS